MQMERIGYYLSNALTGHRSKTSILAFIVTFSIAIMFTSCTNEDNSVVPINSDETPLVQEWDHEYVPFVEEGKVWNCKSFSLETLISFDFAFTMSGDTLIGRHPYKKVLCQYEDYYGDKEQHYYCAVREEAYRVFIVQAEAKVERLLYDFSHPKETLFLSYGDYKLARIPYRSPEFPTKQLRFALYETTGEEIDYSHGLCEWIEGVGYVAGHPFGCDLHGGNQSFDKPVSVFSCTNEKGCIFMKDWLAAPAEDY